MNSEGNMTQLNALDAVYQAFHILRVDSRIFEY